MQNINIRRYKVQNATIITNIKCEYNASLYLSSILFLSFFFFICSIRLKASIWQLDCSFAADATGYVFNAILKARKVLKQLAILKK